MRLSILVLAAILMSGCIKFVTTVNEDGTGTWEIGILFSEEALRASGETGVLTPNEGNEAIIRMLDGDAITDVQSGIVFTAEERLQNGHNWIYITAEIDAPEKWAEVVDAYDRIAPQEDTDPVAANLPSPSVTIDGDMLRVEVDLAFTETGTVGRHSGQFQYPVAVFIRV